MYFKKDSSHKLFIIGTITHRNFGDFAVSEGEYRFISDNFDGKIIEFNEEEISNPLTFKLIDAMIHDKDIILCQGGGNHGNIYGFHEGYRRNIIKRFQKNRIVLFRRHIILPMMKSAEKKLKSRKKSTTSTLI